MSSTPDTFPETSGPDAHDPATSGPGACDDDLRGGRERAAARHDGWSAERQLRFLEALAAHGHVGRAAESVGRSASSAYRLRGRSEAFERAWRAAGAMAYHRLRDLALDRIAFGEVTQQIYHGEVVGTSTRHSDRLLIAMLDHLKPVAFDARVPGARPAPDPAVAYAAAITAYTTAVETGGEPEVPLMADDGRSRPQMTRAEFLALIESRPRIAMPDGPGDADEPLTGDPAAGGALAGGGAAGEEK